MTRLPMAVLTVVLGGRLILRDDLEAGERRSWVLLGMAFVVGLSAHVVSLAQALTPGSAPFPAVADYLYAAPIPAMVAGVMLLPTAVRSRAERRKLLIDSLIVVAGACTALWYLEIAPLLQTPGADFEAIAFAATVPVLDLLLLFALATLVLCRPNLGLVLRLLAASILLKVVTDTTYIMAIVQFDVVYAPGSWPFLLWVTADFLVLLSAHHRLQHDDLRGSARRTYPSFGWLPYVAIALAYGMLVFVARRESLYALGGMILGAMVLTGLVIVRQVIVQRESHRMAVTDSLTGLSSRARINERVAEMTRQPAHDGRCKAVLLIDLDHFKPINDTYGHEAGDAVLKAVATSMRSVIRSGDTAGRLGGDEFAVVLPDLPGREAAEAVARRLVEAFSTPVIFGDLLLNVEASIGVAIHDESTVSQPERLLAHADVAMYVAKRTGRGTFCLYTPELDPRAQDAELRRAVANDEMVVHFQPVVRLTDGHEVGVEALVRWNHPTRGLLMPGAFIELAEETGAVVPIGEWVLREACRQAALWRQTYPQAQHLTLSVNLSVRQVTRADLESTIADILAETGFPADHLVLELTESVVLEPDEATVARMAALRSRGVGIAIDDFGTGYAALSYLRSLPVTVLKIDRSFVAGIDTDADAWAVTEALVHLAEAFSLRVVAEGIETAEQATCLRGMGCEFGQGYHYARPMTGAAFAQRLEAVRLGLPS
ncbi:EAL domain-containing protein [Kineosporia sp. NBRC 101731]|uniref:putative bifunctional diguanylate cyclase/phosphodiesterase n=1 Tax=Kineosporia sp. NBRC 101731 TaxID=3032199 RepID=UPI00255499CD|nr:EAL domain-containing protein [Kineosporia sp. NBRC 101731]